MALAHERLLEEAIVGHAPEEGNQRIPEAAEIDDQDGLGVTVELRPRRNLDHLFQRAEAAGQRNEGIGALRHDSLALMHVGGDDEF